MSLKIHVMYQGIIYRVRGIKVLCSVVLAVIILLVAIVSMGAWMLATAYGTENRSIVSNKLDALQVEQRVVKSPSSIAYRPAIVDSITTDALSTTTKLPHVAYTSKELDKTVSPPKPPLPKDDVVFDDEMFNPAVQKRAKVPKRQRFENADTVYGDRNRVAVSDLITAQSSPKELLEPETSYSESRRKVVHASFPIFGLKELDAQTFFDEPQPDPVRTPIHEGHLREFEYIHSDDANHPTYVGPPVVGYGIDPYARLSPARLEEYDELWKAYMDRKTIPLRPDMKPNLRRLNRPEQVNPLIRRHPRPPVSQQSLTDHFPDFRGTIPTSVRGRRPDPRRPSGPSKMIKPPPLSNPNRELHVSGHVKDTLPTQTGDSPGLLEPLQNIYAYSKRLAASLFSFSSNEEKSMADSSEMFIENGIDLMQDYNNVFQDKNNPLGSMTPSPEKLRSLNPFELSLVTWTFLDYWEFLIEKVGTLSKEDLRLLRQRLDNVRKQKDEAMTRSLVNRTITHISHEQVGPGKAVQTYGDARSLMPGGKGRGIATPVVVRKFLEGLFPSLFSDGRQDFGKDLDVFESTTQVFEEPFPTTDAENSFDNTPTTTESDLAGDDSLVEGRMWDPLGFFSSDARGQFMQYAVKILFNFGKVYVRKPYAVDCTLLLFCKDINRNAKTSGVDGISAKLKSVGLKVLIEKEVREADTFGEVFRAVTAWQPLQCDAMFPKCDGSRALEIVNEVALGAE